MTIKIALAGNPNSGKTSIFNALTGSAQYVGNWPGVTVEKKEGSLRGHKNVALVDLPGIYSLSPYSPEEIVSRDYLVKDRPDAIINVVDASNIERNLYLTTQIVEVGVPVVIALNMIDVVRKKGDKIDLEKLSEKLGCAVVETSAIKNIGLTQVVEKAIELAGKREGQKVVHYFGDKVEVALQKIENLIADMVDPYHIHWYAVKLFERDQKVLGHNKGFALITDRVDDIVTACEKAADDDSQSLIISNRYNYIETVVADAFERKTVGSITISDKIDAIVTNRILALPIFALVMFTVYYTAISTIGTMGTDWVNDVLFGNVIPPAIEAGLVALGCADWLQSLVLDGVVAGVGAVLGFLPQMAVLFFLLAILEDSGYMARVAFVMDRVFRYFGLSGKSFIPILVGTGCGVPGIMASRTIESDRERRITVITTTFIPCGAKLPVIALIAGALFPGVWWVGPSAYFAGIAAIIVSGLILKKSRLLVGDAAPFVMELPAYHMPSPRGVLFHTWERCKHFIKKAGTIIFIACVIIWLLSNFSWGLHLVDAQDSMLASVGKVIAPLFIPLGWGQWEAAVASITGLIAKENLVGTFGVLYGFAEVAEDGAEVWSNLQAAFTPLAAYSLLIFNLLCVPCMAAVGAIRREMNSAKWTWFAIGYQTGFAYAVALCIYQFGMFFTGNGFNIWTAVAVIIVGGMLMLMVRKEPKQIAIEPKQEKAVA